MRKFIVWLIVFICISGCEANSAATSAANPKGPTMSFALTSSAFAQGQPIPVKYTCDGQSVSPPLQWDVPPTNTQSLALIMDDPDAPSGTFVHWVLYNLPADLRDLPEEATLPAGSQVGQNGTKRPQYTGPCPPSGTHRYFFKLYALDTPLTLPNGADKSQLLTTMQGHILGQAELMGTYAKK
jgi:Raf kinase inhibitor-like YbhB/YbcL family protein